jgi:hypothetical protein
VGFKTTQVRGLIFYEVVLCSSVQTGTRPPGVLHFRIAELLFGEALRQIVLLATAKVKWMYSSSRLVTLFVPDLLYAEFRVKQENGCDCRWSGALLLICGLGTAPCGRAIPSTVQSSSPIYRLLRQM